MRFRKPDRLSELVREPVSESVPVGEMGSLVIVGPTVVRRWPDGVARLYPKDAGRESLPLPDAKAGPACRTDIPAAVGINDCPSMYRGFFPGR